MIKEPPTHPPTNTLKREREKERERVSSENTNAVISSQLCRHGITRVEEAEPSGGIRKEGQYDCARQIYSRNAQHRQEVSAQSAMYSKTIKLEWTEGGSTLIYPSID